MLKIAATDLGEMYSPLSPEGYANYQLIARARTDAERLIGLMRRAARAADDRVLAQATRNITLEDIGRMATRANVKTVVL